MSIRRPARNRHEFRFGTYEGKPAAFARLPDSREVALDAAIAREMLRLELSNCVYLRGNGTGTSYPSIHLWLPEPWRARATIQLARIAAVIAADAKFDAGQVDEQLPAKGWTIGYVNGDHFDLRAANLEVRPAEGSRNTYTAAWSVRHRRDLADAGKSVEAFYRAKRKSYRASKKDTGE